MRSNYWFSCVAPRMEAFVNVVDDYTSGRSKRYAWLCYSVCMLTMPSHNVRYNMYNPTIGPDLSRSLFSRNQPTKAPLTHNRMSRRSSLQYSSVSRCPGASGSPRTRRRSGWRTDWRILNCLIGCPTCGV